MADYTKATNFTAKDGLPTGNAGKIVKGAEIDTELTAVSNAIASKADINSPTFTGTPAAPTATAGTNTTQVASTAFVIAERTNTATLTNKTLTSPTINTPTISTPAITGGTITGITDLAVADGGTGVSTIAANAVILGNGTSAIQTVAPSTAGNILTSNGTTWASTAPAYTGARGQVFTSNGTFTVPAGITSIKVTVQSGGGGGGGNNTAFGTTGGGGGGGANAVTFYTGLTPANTLTVTVGGGGAAGVAGSSPTNGTAGGTSSIASGTQSITSTTCTGGGGGERGMADRNGSGGAGGSASGASFSINAGSNGQSAMSTNSTGYGLGGSGGDPATAGTAGIVIVEW